MHEYEYERPALVVDAIVMFHNPGSEDQAQVLLIRRGIEPFKGKWAFPGVHVEKYEQPEVACVREVFEETGVRVGDDLELFRVKGHKGRDPRGWVVAITYLTWSSSGNPVAGDAAAEARWFDADALPPMAFDHRETFDEWWELEEGER